MMIEQQNKYYERQFQLMKASSKIKDSLQHDFYKHLLSIRTCLKSNMIDEAIIYIDKMLEIDFGSLNRFSNTGNAVIDSILNAKIQEAKNKNIKVITKLQIPEDLEVDSFDVTIILGNIIDNAIEATERAINNKEISIVMIYDRKRIWLCVENTYSGNIRTKQGRLLTSKSSSSSHGIGLQNVEAAVNKYDGTVDISYDNGRFRICIMLYV